MSVETIGLDEDIPEGDAVALRHELIRQRRLSAASYALHTTLDLDELLNLILVAASEGVDADRGTVFLLSDDRQQLWSKVLQGDQQLEIRLPVGKGIAGAVAETGETVRIPDAYDDPRFDQSWDKKSGFRTRQILCAPIRNRDGRTVGVFQLLNKRHGDFDEADERYLAALSIHAALAVENARLHHSAIEKERQDREILLVQNVQRAIQPERASSEVGSLQIAGLNVLCEDASGDYYDFIELERGRVGVVIGDVSGHGLHSALVMAQARAYLRSFCKTIATLDEVVNLLNDFLAKDMTGGSFMTLFMAVVDPADGRVEWCSAGHLPSLHVHRGGAEIAGLASTGRVLGIFPDAGYKIGAPITLAPGDLLFLYTDGVTEAVAPGGEMFQESRLRDVLAASVSGTPEGVLDTVKDALLTWTGQPQMNDDLTMIAIKRAK